MEALATTLNLVSSENEGDGEEEVGSLSRDQRKRVRLGAHLGTGIASYLSGDLESSLKALETALQEVEDPSQQTRTDIVVQTAQILWASGQKHKAQTKLLDHISSGGGADNLRAILALGAMGAVSDDETPLEAATSELQSVEPAAFNQTNATNDIDKLLSTVELLKGRPSEALSILSKTVLLAPDALRAMTAQCALVETVIRLGQSTEMALEEAWKLHGMVHSDVEVGQNFIEKAETLLAAAESMEQDSSTKSVRSRTARAVAFEPWKTRNWKALAAVS